MNINLSISKYSQRVVWIGIFLPFLILSGSG